MCDTTTVQNDHCFKRNVITIYEYVWSKVVDKTQLINVQIIVTVSNLRYKAWHEMNQSSLQ